MDFIKRAGEEQLGAKPKYKRVGRTGYRGQGAARTTVENLQSFSILTSYAIKECNSAFFQEKKVRLMKTIVPWVFVTGEIHILKWDMNQAFWGHSGCGHARWAFLPPTPVYRERLDLDLWIPTGPSLPLEKEEGWA